MVKYRIARDGYDSRFWAVQQKVWWWPFWMEVGNGLLESAQEAEDLIEHLKTHF